MPADETTLLTGDREVAAAILFMDTTEEIARHWRWILFMGFFNILTGGGCLLFPIFATEVAELFVTSLVFATGLLNMMTICANEQGSSHQNHFFWVGVAQVLLAFLMFTNPFFTLTILTFLVAVTFVALGSVQIAAARKYREMIAARGLMFVSGSVAIVMSFLICLSMPTAKFYTIGVLMGVNLINIGTNRIIIALYGRRIASSDASAESWRSYLDADLV
jgi:uncharacterized membrane protein HdeD (DUF308 family)